MIQSKMIPRPHFTLTGKRKEKSNGPLSQIELQDVPTTSLVQPAMVLFVPCIYLYKYFPQVAKFSEEADRKQLKQRMRPDHNFLPMPRLVGTPWYRKRNFDLRPGFHQGPPFPPFLLTGWAGAHPQDRRQRLRILPSQLSQDSQMSMAGSVAQQQLCLACRRT